MLDELVSLETAKLAYEKGFNIITYPFYEQFDIKLNRHKNLHEGYSAPTQSLLQRWLREKHNIHIEIELASDHELNILIPYIYQFDIYKDGDGVFDRNFYNTYEEALEVGLYEALKLIKDV